MILPYQQNFRLAPGWMPHGRCWMAWPSDPAVWAAHLDAARQSVAEIATAIARFEPVTMVVKPAHVAEVSLLTGAGVSQLSLAHDDCRMRDMGPAFLVDPENRVAGVRWGWSGLGGRCKAQDQDAGIAEAILDHLGMRRFAMSLMLEGGAIETDGEGTLMASEAVLLNPNRNPDQSREAVEEMLITHLGVRQVIWLGGALQDDPAGGHAVHLARFIRPGVVLAMSASDPADPNHAVLHDNLSRLRAARDAQGRVLEVIEIEQPHPRFDSEGRRLALSYTSFYLPNNAVLLPAFEDSVDNRAFDLLSRLYPERTVIQVPALEIAYGGCGIATLTLPQPEGPAAAAE